MRTYFYDSVGFITFLIFFLRPDTILGHNRIIEEICILQVLDFYIRRIAHSLVIGPTHHWHILPTLSEDVVFGLHIMPTIRTTIFPSVWMTFLSCNLFSIYFQGNVGIVDILNILGLLILPILSTNLNYSDLAIRIDNSYLFFQ